jgi:hypothetical protein
MSHFALRQNRLIGLYLTQAHSLFFKKLFEDKFILVFVAIFSPKFAANSHFTNIFKEVSTQIVKIIAIDFCWRLNANLKFPIN